MDIFERHTSLNQLNVRRKFYTARMEPMESARTFTNRILHLGTRIYAMSLVVHEKGMTMAALNGLPARFCQLSSALDAVGNEGDALTLKVLKSRLLQE